MAFQHVVTSRVVVENRTHSFARTFSADGSDSREITIAIGASDYEVVIAIDFSELKSLFIAADQDLTLETNSGAVPDDTISLKADAPMVWNEDSYFSNPFTADVTSIFVTNASGVATTLIIEVVQDATP